MRCKGDTVNWVERDSTQLARFADQLLSEDGKHMGRWDGGHVVDDNLQFLREFVFWRVGFDGS